jgi:nucleoid-associated protein YgaU
MVAVAQQGQRVRPRHLRLVTDGYEELAARRRERELAVLRRRLVAVALVVGLLVALGLALGRAGSTRSAFVGPDAGVSAGALPIAQAEYVVQPGDTLWKIARALQPEGDVRPLVYDLGKARNGAPLRPGERITLP